MMHIYASRKELARLMPYLAEFKCRVFINYPIKGMTRKVRGKVSTYRVHSFPIN